MEVYPMFKKLTNILKTNNKTCQANSHTEEIWTDMEELNEHVKRQDKQLNRLFEGLERAGENLDEKIKVYEEIIMNEGMLFNGPSHLSKYLDLLYKQGDFDKLWATLNTYSIKYTHMFTQSELSNYRCKVLIKEGKFKEALYHNVVAVIAYIIDNEKALIEMGKEYYREITDEYIIKQIERALKKNGIVNREKEILAIIKNHAAKGTIDAIKVRDDVKQFLSG